MERMSYESLAAENSKLKDQVLGLLGVLRENTELRARITDLENEKPFIYVHELYERDLNDLENVTYKGNDIWLGCPSEADTRAAYIPNETGEEVIPLYRVPQLARLRVPPRLHEVVNETDFEPGYARGFNTAIEQIKKLNGLPLEQADEQDAGTDDAS